MTRPAHRIGLALFAAALLAGCSADHDAGSGPVKGPTAAGFVSAGLPVQVPMYASTKRGGGMKACAPARPSIASRSGRAMTTPAPPRSSVRRDRGLRGMVEGVLGYAGAEGVQRAVFIVRPGARARATTSES